MSEIVCPKCSSSQLFANKKGFSGKKAVAGAILTGGVGLLAGTIGSNKVKITCLSCGNVFNPGQGKPVKHASNAIVLENEPTDIERAVINNIREHGMLKAVLGYKDLMGVDLKQAKSFVDSVADRYNVEPVHKGSGCAGVILIFLLITFSFYSFLK